MAADPSAAGRRAFAYLPADARIRAKVYPVIKPKENSFVFEVDTDPAIFLYIDSSVTKEQLENTLAHELHHIGFGTACPSRRVEAKIEGLPERTRTVLRWIGAFGEGAAMLAAAGGPGVHPHAVSPEKDRARWDRDVANVDADLTNVETFFLDVLSGTLAGDAATAAAFTFFGEQGAWYTVVDWRMCVTIEKAFGRGRLITSLCDPRALLLAYNEAAAKLPEASRPAVWSASFLERLSGG